MSFVHLHTHSHYTFQQAFGTPEDIIKRAKALGQNAIALTDVGNLHGAFDFYVAGKKEGIKAIIGVEFLISEKGRANRERGNNLYEIVLLAKNFDGYQNLIQLVTYAQKEGYYNGSARIDWELLERFSGDLIGLSGSIYGEIAQHITTGQDEGFIRERIEYYEGIFGRGNFYLEIEEHPDRPIQTRINTELVALSRKYHFPLVGTQNSYYIAPEDAEIRDLIACVADGRALDDPDRPSLISGEYSIRPSEEMRELFVYANEAYENTQKIADTINIEIPYGEYQIPSFPLNEEEQEDYDLYMRTLDADLLKLSTEEWLLRRMCIRGLGFRYDFHLTEEDEKNFIDKVQIEIPEKKLSDMSVEELYTISESYYSEEKKGIIAKMSDNEKTIISRLEYELTVVDLMGFNGYFCIVADFIRYAKENNVPVGPGRGSAAGAILAYLSGITDIDPLRYGLLFERFLNPARVTMPDIDVDFSDAGRDEVLDYVRRKYGEDHVAQVCTFGTLAARAAVKDAGKALGMSFSDMNILAKQIPGNPGITLEKALKESPEFLKTYESDEKYKKIIDSAKKMEGTVRQLGVHACAVIIAPEPITRFCPIQPPPKDPRSTVTQFSAHPLEDLGLLKMDFLGLKNLTILARAIAVIKRVHGIEIDLLKIDYEDPKVLARFGAGDTTGLFQFESAGMRKYLQQLKPSGFEDLIAMVSLYRPGPLAFIPDFIDRKYGRKKIEYPHPSLEAILKPTYGIAVYQEQIMQLVQAFAGFSLGQADILRRAIGKKKYDLLMEQRAKFIEAAQKQGNPEALAVYIFDEIIEPFAGYGFNKSHAACYAMIAYQTAYLKNYYDTEFMTAIMTSDEEDTDRIRLEIEEAESKGIKVLPPDVNESMKHFTYIDTGVIRFGLKAIKGLGQGPITAVQEGRKEKKYETITEFIENTGSDVINKKSLESLIYAGALDSLGERASLLASIPKMIAYLKEIESKKETSQLGLFDLSDEMSEHHSFTLEDVPPMTFEDKIKGEKLIIGYPVSGHPLSGLEKYIEEKSKNIGMIKEWLKYQESKEVEEEIPEVVTEEIEKVSSSEEEKKTEIPETKTTSDTAYKDLPKAQLIGVVQEVRNMVTKKGTMMCSAKVQTIGFDFRVVIFARSYDELAPKVQEDAIIVCNGKIRLDESSKEITMIPDAITSYTLTKFREIHERYDQARRDEGRMARESSRTEAHEVVPSPSETEENIHPPKQEEKYMLFIPEDWSKEDLLALRQFLEGAPRGTTPIWISVHGLEKDTKFTLEDTTILEQWIREYK